MQKIRSHYQNKLNTLRKILNVYQEKVEKKKANWEAKVEVAVLLLFAVHEHRYCFNLAHFTANLLWYISTFNFPVHIPCNPHLKY